MKRHPAFRSHPTPRGSSGLELVERWFREITGKRIRRGAPGGVKQLVQATTDQWKRQDENPKAFVWSAKAEDILAEARRAGGDLCDRLSV